MFYFIKDGEIVGTADSNIGLPGNFQAVEFEEIVDISLLYFDGEEICLKPQKPGENFFWDANTNQWKEIPSVEFIRGYDWDKLLVTLQSSDEWAKAYSASERTLKANTAYTTLLVVLTNTRQVGTLEWAVAKLREAMATISGIGDFTVEEIESINQKLEDAGFSITLG